MLPVQISTAIRDAFGVSLAATNARTKTTSMVARALRGRAGVTTRNQMWSITRARR